MPFHFSLLIIIIFLSKILVATDIDAGKYLFIIQCIARKEEGSFNWERDNFTLLT